MFMSAHICTICTVRHLCLMDLYRFIDFMNKEYNIFYLNQCVCARYSKRIVSMSACVSFPLCFTELTVGSGSFFSLSCLPSSFSLFIISPSFWHGCWTCGRTSPTKRRMCHWLSDFIVLSWRVICTEACWQIRMERRSPDVWVTMWH